MPSSARLEIEPAHTEKVDIEHQASRNILPPRIEELLGRALGARLKTDRTAKAVHRAAQPLIVIDDVNNRLVNRLLWHVRPPSVATSLNAIPRWRPAPGSNQGTGESCLGSRQTCANARCGRTLRSATRARPTISIRHGSRARSRPQSRNPPTIRAIAGAPGPRAPGPRYELHHCYAPSHGNRSRPFELP